MQSEKSVVAAALFLFFQLVNNFCNAMLFAFQLYAYGKNKPCWVRTNSINLENEKTHADFLARFIHLEAFANTLCATVVC